MPAPQRTLEAPPDRQLAPTLLPPPELATPPSAAPESLPTPQNLAAPERPAPTSDRERVGELDLLRGFALLGVMLMNIPHFSGWDWLGRSSALELVLNVLAEGKFISLFSMLFGYGFATQLLRARDGDGARRTARRCIGLLGIGLAHALLLFSGDILVSYAVGGLLLLAFRNVSAARAIKWAIALWSIGSVLLVALAALSAQAIDPNGQMEWAERLVTAYDSGSYADVVRARLSESTMQWSSLPLFLPQLLATFLIGLAAARSRIFTGGVAQEALLSRARALALPVGLLLSIGSAVVANATNSVAVSSGAYVAGLATAPILAIGYVGLLVPLYRSGAFGTLAPRIEAVGRIGLTNYLAHSVVFSLLFCGYAGGMFLEMSYAASALVAVVTYALMLLISPWWLARYRFGPGEWLLRSFTYRARQPMRRSGSHASITEAKGPPLHPHAPAARRVGATGRHRPDT